MDASELRKKAIKNVQVADHMLSQTYPMVKDPKLLLAVMDNIYLAFLNTIHSVLLHERDQKNINAFGSSFDSLFNTFKLKIAPKYDIDKEYLSILQDIRVVVVNHKKSPVEFARKDKFVICGDNYQLQTVSVDQLKNYISKARDFLRTMDGLV